MDDRETLVQIARLEAIVSREVGRGIEPLIAFARGGLHAAAQSVAAHPSPHIAIITGFYVSWAEDPAAENDGPPGAAHMAAAFRRIGLPVRIATDGPCAAAVGAAMAAAGLRGEVPLDVVALAAGDGEALATVRERWRRMLPPISHVIAIERCGRAADGTARNMRGQDISAHTAPLDHLFTAGDWVKIAMGDGGNEIGMGSVPPEVMARARGLAPAFACVTPCDHLMVLGVSNWGGYALTAALGLLRPELRAPLLAGLSPAAEARVLAHVNRAGPAVDGVLGRNTLHVDGLAWPVHAEVLERLAALLRGAG